MTIVHRVAMSQRPPMPSPAPARPRGGFTLVEMLVTVAVIVVLLGILVPVFRTVRQGGTTTRELNLARQLMGGVAAYSHDNRGVIIPGYYDLAPLPATDQHGNALGAEESHRYLWRLAPYLDYSVEALVPDQQLVEEIRATNQYEYFLSLYTPLGMNTVFIGGDSRPEGLGFNNQFRQLYGDFYLTRMSQARRPAELITFASARTNAPYGPAAPPIIEGFHRVESPYLFNRRWDATWDETATPKKWGYLSMRNGFRRAGVGFLDGHVDTLDDGEIQDMRRWCDRADTPDWTLQPQ